MDYLFSQKLNGLFMFWRFVSNSRDDILKKITTILNGSKKMKFTGRTTQNWLYVYNYKILIDMF